MSKENSNYYVQIAGSTGEFTAKEKLALISGFESTSIDKATECEELVIKPCKSAVLAIHNENSDNKDYNLYVIVDADGNYYTTSSESCFTSYENVMDGALEMEIPFSEIEIKFVREASAKREGKYFLKAYLA